MLFVWPHLIDVSYLGILHMLELIIGSSSHKTTSYMYNASVWNLLHGHILTPVHYHG